ncbi:uncharacterized protein LOC142320235 [Lycorma delicatula]|uniref:uncharacterized protein LOC142320235 n=1 Tax=Lycorma delicatula TaxID=130591 RepID=UPI003F5169DA
MTQENKNGTITEKQFLEKLKILRITGSSISELQSNSLKKLRNLEVLILAGNGINKRKGLYVPKNVKYLELFANNIINLSDFISGLPTKLLHFGLGRNLLTNFSAHHIILVTEIRELAENQVLKNLLVLDLEDNNIKDLDHIVDLLHNVTPVLCALTLQGNPCSYMPIYFYKIIKKLPKLMILDEEDVTDYNFNQPEITDELNPGISISCWRLIKIKQPEKKKLNKKIQDTFHIEVETLLLDEGLRNWQEKKIQKSILSEMPIEEEEDILVTKPEDGEQTNQPPKILAKSSKSKTPKKKLKEPSPPDVHELMLQDILRNDKQLPGVTKFESDKMPWSDIIVYKEPTIQLFIPNKNLELLRDTFRSQIIIRVVHVKALSSTKKTHKTKSIKESEPVS